MQPDIAIVQTGDSDVLAPEDNQPQTQKWLINISSRIESCFSISLTILQIN